MSTACGELHEIVRGCRRFGFDFDANQLPDNGIYVLFEKREGGHGGDRIVRIGTHTGEGQLRSRLAQHFLASNKDRSIFRKNIGRALLSQAQDAFLADWEIDLTTHAARHAHGARIDSAKLAETELAVSTYMHENFSFATIPVEGSTKRLSLEAKMIATVASCEECGPSSGWLGLASPKEKIRQSGLWLVNELKGESLGSDDLRELARMSGCRSFNARTVQGGDP